MKNLSLKFIILFTVSLSFTACNFKSEQADLIVHNAKIYSLDDNNNVYQAMAIKDGEIVALGAEREILNRYRYNEILDAKTAVVYPGFIDAHCHFLGLGLSKQQVNLLGVKSLKEMLESTQKQANTISTEWIYGFGWNNNLWEKNAYPHKNALDSMFPNRPVLLRRIDGHSAIANQKALDLAQINEKTFIEGGEIQTDANGLTGILVDNAMHRVKDLIPDFNLAEKAKALLDAQEICLSYGLVAITDAGLTTSEILLIDSLQKTGDLKMNVMAMVADKAEDLAYWFDLGPLKSPSLNVTSVKTYSDGALGSRGAAMLEPYSDAPEVKGLILKPESYYQDLAKQCYENNFQLNAHAIGDAANRLMLDIFAQQLQRANDRRWRIEHCQILDSADLEKFKNFTIIPSVQPTHYTSDHSWAIDRVGPERMKFAYANQTLKNQLGILPLGTDFPIEEVNPFKTFYAAVFRVEPGETPTQEDSPEAISKLDALKGITLWPAIAGFSEEYRGTLEVGKKADFVVSNVDLLKTDNSKLLDFKVSQTFINGLSVK